MIYLIGSLRNPAIPEIGQELRAAGFEVFDDWFAAGPEADDYWMKYEKNRGHNLGEALKGNAAQHVFNFDKKFLDKADSAVLVLPAGKSGHLELGYIIGQGKPGYILFDNVPEPDRFDVMYNFASGVFFDRKSLIEKLSELPHVAPYNLWNWGRKRNGDTEDYTAFDGASANWI
jgi:nucleoside 2-deoxyribosyltransferase